MRILARQRGRHRRSKEGIRLAATGAAQASDVGDRTLVPAHVTRPLVVWDAYHHRASTAPTFAVIRGEANVVHAPVTRPASLGT